MDAANKANRYCVIMCGGVGSRFWPYSRSNRPKQFIDFFGSGRSLLQMTYDRVVKLVPEENVIIVTNLQYGDLVREQLPNIAPWQVLFEPARRNTAPCVAWAAYHIKALNPDALIMVAPSDHLVLKEDEYQTCIERGFQFIAQHDVLLTLGIQPSRPETGYGYIQLDKSCQTDGFFNVKTFTEKPNLEMARLFLSTGEFVWNSGMFLWKVDTIINAFQKYASEMADVLAGGTDLLGTDREQEFINQVFPSFPNISIDFAIMEKAPNVCVQRVEFGWSDLGTWGSLYDNSPKNSSGNVAQKCNAIMYNGTGNVVVANNGKLVVTSGLDDYIIADSGDVLLIVPKAEEQQIKNYVNDVKLKFGEKFI